MVQIIAIINSGGLEKKKKISGIQNVMVEGHITKDD